jgi:hypothetical protein
MNEFPRIVDEILGDALKAHGFARVAEDRDFVEYESRACTLAVSYDSRRSNEVFVGLSRRDRKHGPDFDFREVIRAASVPTHLQPMGYAAIDDKSIRHLLQTVAMLLTSYCLPLLRGEEDAWLQLIAQRNTDAARYAADSQVTLALNDATDAWRTKDMAKVVELLGPVRPLLGTADRTKLEYAERKLRDT